MSLSLSPIAKQGSPSCPDSIMGLNSATFSLTARYFFKNPRDDVMSRYKNLIPAFSSFSLNGPQLTHMLLPYTIFFCIFAIEIHLLGYLYHIN